MKNHTDSKNIDLPASITEGGNPRTVDTSDNLLEWLFLYRKPFGKILPETSAGNAGHYAAPWSGRPVEPGERNTGVLIVRSLS